MRRLVHVLGGLACLLSGCLPDLSYWEVLPVADGGVVDPPRDAGAPPRICPLPHLLVAAENLEGGAGAILRYELPSEGGVRACAPLTAGGSLLPQPFSVAAPSEGFVLAAGRDGVQAVDPRSDTLLYAIAQSGQHPNDAFPLFDAGRGDWVAAVAWSNIGSSSGPRGGIRVVIAYDAAGSERARWDGGALGVSSANAITSAPSAVGPLLAMSPSSFSAAQLDPFVPVLRTSPPLVGSIAGTVLTSIAAGTGGGHDMLAWTGRVDGAPRVLALDAPYTDDVSQVTCGDMPCDFEHVAIDVTRPRAVLALCGLSGVERSIVRLDFERTLCEPLVGAESVPSGMRLSYLAFARSR